MTTSNDNNSTSSSTVTTTETITKSNTDKTAPATVFEKATSSSSTSSTTTTTTTATTTNPTLPSPPPKEKTREKFAMISYNDYVLSHEQVLEDYSIIKGMEETQKFLFNHCDVLLHEHAQSYMLLSCLEDEMNGKKERMKLVCRQSQILSHISELGVQMHRDPRDVILPFFRRMEEKQYLNGFLSAVEEFRQRIIERAKVKRREMEKEERSKIQAPLGPGGLDPYEVLESLPDVLREAFESQEIEQLQKVIAEMNPKEAKYHMKRCVDSGLWVARYEWIINVYTSILHSFTYSTYTCVIIKFHSF